MKSFMLMSMVITANTLWAANSSKMIQFKLKSTDIFQCATQGKVQVDLYGNADQSLFFIKTKIQNSNITLPELASASGMRFSDDFSWVITMDAEELGIERKNEDGKFELVEICPKSSASKRR